MKLSSYNTVPGFSNSNYRMVHIGNSHNSNHYAIVNRYGNIVTVGKRKHVVEVWNNAGTADYSPMVMSA